MQQLKFFVVIIIIALLFQSCERCRYIECRSGNNYGQFRIVSASDGKDLVFGATKIYDKNKIRFFSLKDNDTTFFEYEALKFPNTGYDSILYVRFLPRTDMAYIQLGNGDVDTLQLTYKTSGGSKCCPAVIDITNFRLNNSQDIPGNEGTQEIKK